MMVPLLLLAFPLLAVATQPVSWFLARDLSVEATEKLTKQLCFRGTYGQSDLSIFTCEGFNGEKFAVLEADAPLCVVELSHSGDALKLITSRGDARVLWKGENEIILTSANSNDYPTLSCGSRSDYSGAALNVIRIPRTPILPEQTLETANLAPDVRIADLIGYANASSLQNWVTTLASFYSRNSYAASAQTAVDWVEEQLANYGFHTSQQQFDANMCKNIIAERTGTDRPNDIIMIGAHLDSRAGSSTNATSYAPGADDNGSGSATVLELARILYEQNFQTEHTIRLLLFCGEEQGLRGSDYMALGFSQDSSKRYVAYYNADMIGWNCGGKGNQSNPLAFMSGASSRILTDECKGIVREYLPTLNIGDTTACCSDQQSFNKYGIASLGIFECPGSGVSYPYYHTSQDVPDAVDYDQVLRFGQAVYSCFLTRAIPSGPL